MQRKYSLNKINFNAIYDRENCSANQIVKTSGVSIKTINRLLDEAHPTISEYTAHQLAVSYGFKVYDLIGDEVL